MYILVYTCFWAVHVSTRPFPLESYTPDASRYRSVLVGMYYSMTFDAMVCTALYQGIGDLIICPGTYSYKVVHTSIYQYVLVHTSTYEVHQRTDQYMPKKKVQTDLEPAILCITRPEFTPVLWGYRP